MLNKNLGVETRGATGGGAPTQILNTQYHINSIAIIRMGFIVVA